MYYSQEKETIYSGDKAHWQDIQLNTTRPSLYHSPEIENNQHTGEWTLDESKQREASIPESVSNRQGMLALIEFDIIDLVLANIDAIEDTKERRKAEVELNASTWEFNSPFLRSMWFSIPDATETQLEDLFIYANQQ